MTLQKVAAKVSAVSGANKQAHDLGELHIDEVGNHYRYFKNYTTGALTAYLLYAYDPDTWTIVGGVNTTLAAAGEVHPLCVPQIAVTQGTTANAYYFWAFVGPGRATFTSVAGITAEAKIYTSATAGKIDDDSSGEILIPGLISYDAFASAVTGICKASCELYVSA